MANPFNPRLFVSSFILFLFFLFTAFSAVITGVENPQYSDYCSNVVPEPLPPFTSLTDPSKPSLSKASFDYPSDHPDSADSGRTLTLRTDEIYRTRSGSVFKLDGALFIRNLRTPGQFSNSTRRGPSLVHFRPPRIPVNGYYRSDFSVSGFWNSSSGKLCMVGKGNQRLGSVYGVLKLDYPDESSIFTSLVNGSLEIFNEDGKLLDYLHILGVSSRNYEYKLIEEAVYNNAFKVFDNLTEVSLGIDNREICQVYRNQGFHELKYLTDCESVNCDFLGGGKGNATLPGGIYMHQIACSDSGFVRYLLGSKLPIEPGSALVAEGKWNNEKKRLEMVGCRIVDVEGTISDCSVRLILRQPAVYTIQQRSGVVGEIWSSKSSKESGYFGSMALHGVGDRQLDFRSSVRYEYTQLEKVRKSCSDKMISNSKGGTYPYGTSQDMMFNMVVKNGKGDEVFGTTSPFSVGDALVEPGFGQEVSVGEGFGQEDREKLGENGLVNVSFHMDFNPLHDFNLSGDVPQFSRVDILTEGIYDSKNGHLCMVGCMRLVFPGYETFRTISHPDCEILVDLQYPPMNARHKTMIKGTIETTRKKSDPRYFEPLTIVSRSLYSNQARESLWRMDLEIIMVLVSNSLVCIVVGLQLFYVKKHPDILPFISVVMLTVLTLAHLIPLLLNFEALFFSNHSRQNNVYLGSDGWLEVNEVLVRVITMVAFLLEFRLLQLTWSAKNSGETQRTIWVSERKVLYISLPLYIAGSLIAWLSHLSTKSSRGRSLLLLHQDRVHKDLIFWKDLKCFAGLILDGFLFPQILFNIFHDSKVKALAPSFYIGTTIIRLLPHGYDLYRAHISPTMPVHYIYANPSMDFYSTTWDISICTVGLLFAVLVCLQQRFGGRFFLLKKFRQNVSYEKVPVVSTGN